MAAANQMSSSSIQDGEKATQPGRVSVSLASGYDCERYENGRKGSFWRGGREDAEEEEAEEEDEKEENGGTGRGKT